MPYVLIIHDVDSYASWKIIFDRAAAARKAAGEISFLLLAAAAEPDRIVHISRWRSLDDARRFFESPAIAALRCEAGVHAPDFLYLHELERGTL